MLNKRRNQGFTLVELSIVLVIIGLIIGGVLTGRQIMENAQITNTLDSIQAYEAQFQTYVQNYGAIPGDDNGAVARFPGSDLAANGNGNGNGDGTMQGAFDSVTNTDETRLIWGDLRAAGLVKGAVTTNQPPNAFNGIFGFQHGAFNGAFTSNVLCLNNVPADAAQSIDSRLDDGISNSGTIQAMVSTGVAGEAVAGTPAANYGAGLTYTVCVRM